MRVQNFAGFMKSRNTGKVNEQDDYAAGDNMDASTMYGTAPNWANEYDDSRHESDFGANPEEDEEVNPDEEAPEGEDESGEQEEVTLEDLKAMLDDLTERVEKLEGGGEEEEGAEGEEDAEGEEGVEGEEAPAEEEEAKK